MSDNIVNFSDFVKNKRGPTGDFADYIFDEAVKREFDIPEIITSCLILINVLCVVRPEHVEGVRQVANEIVGTP
jgi:hypothetical protein